MKNNIEWSDRFSDKFLMSLFNDIYPQYRTRNKCPDGEVRDNVLLSSSFGPRSFPSSPIIVTVELQMLGDTFHVRHSW